MGHWEDLHYEIHENLQKYGLQKEYRIQLETMSEHKN